MLMSEMKANVEKYMEMRKVACAYAESKSTYPDEDWDLVWTEAYFRKMDELGANEL